MIGIHIQTVDKTKIDGVILSDGHIEKVSDALTLPKAFTVNLTVKEDKNGNISFSKGLSTVVNAGGDFVKGDEEEKSGSYCVGDGSKAGNWIPYAPTQQELKHKLGKARYKFFTKAELFPPHIARKVQEP